MKPSHRTRFFLAFSLSLMTHVFLLFATWFGTALEKHQNQANAPLQLEIFERGIEAPRNLKSANKVDGPTKAAAPKRIPREALLQHLNPGPDVPVSRSTDSETDSNMDSSNQSFEQVMELEPFLKSTLARIDQEIGYPADFVENRIAGKVSLQIKVDGSGRLSGDVQAITGEKRILELYVLLAVVKALSTPLPERLQRAEGTSIRVTVQFETFSLVGNSPELKETFLNGNDFKLVRRAYVESIFNEHYKNFVVRYVPPVIILPGFFYIDFYHAYSMYQAWSKPDPNGLRQFRLDQAKQMLEQSRQQKDPSRPNQTLPPL